FWLSQTGHPGKAAVALEAGRAISATQIIERERVTAELRRSGQQDLADQYERTVRKLAELEQSDSGGKPVTMPGAGNHLDDLDAAHRQYTALRAQIAGFGGLSAMFRPVELADIARAAQHRPVVYLAAAERAGLAVVVDGTGPRLMPLPGLTASR